MLPPVLEIYVVWHPRDAAGAEIVAQLDAHFHGDLFTGLIGGAVEVYARSDGWLRPGGAPRRIPVPGDPPPNGVAQAQYVVIVPVLDFRLAQAAADRDGEWYEYLAGIRGAQCDAPDRVTVFPVLADLRADEGALGELFGELVYIVVNGVTGETPQDRRRRDLVQSIAQFVGGDAGRRLTVFISHTRRTAEGDGGRPQAITERVRAVIAQTRLADFFDAQALGPGRDYSEEIASAASSSALLALRSDHYASRDWCQREVVTAKTAGMPVVILDALVRGDPRGSFLMDHAPRVPVTGDDGGIWAGLNLLVDEWLKRLLWRRQHELAERAAPDLGVGWWAPHAPEPTTLAAWLAGAHAAGERPTSLRILHPDPPLGGPEREVLARVAALGGIATLEILTPRQLAARGG
ncbi:hypothetical protein [Dactylosporangium salmoneum]|uniref:TIR domain-containing protein n=1 Tax=Dactylosporangium salmoneum TaxID=53361 RepID=A0ABN3HUL0_9ACTN